MGVFSALDYDALRGLTVKRGTIAMPFIISSPAFAEGETIPERHTGVGANTSPPLAWSGEPEGTHSFALIADDPDAPVGTWNHWLVWDIPGHLHALPEDWRPGSAGSAGRNDFGRPGYGGPMPPKGHGPHRYFFTLHALDRPRLGLPAGASRADLDRALAGRTLARAACMGRFERK
jgi:Raf kinase inhibitor-like YbhB/YbcL family protein